MQGWGGIHVSRKEPQLELDNFMQLIEYFYSPAFKNLQYCILFSAILETVVASLAAEVCPLPLHPLLFLKGFHLALMQCKAASSIVVPQDNMSQARVSVVI